MSYDYDRLSKGYNPGRWFRFPIDLLGFLTDREAIILSSVVNIICMRYEDGETIDGWILLPASCIQATLHDHYTKTKIHETLARLKEKGIIETKVETRDRLQSIRVIYQKLEELEFQNSKVGKGEHAKTDFHAPVNPYGSPVNPDLRARALQYTRNYKKPRSARMINVASITKAPYREYATRLYEMVSSVRKVNGTSNPGTWHRYFRILHKKGISHEQIDAVLTWYKRLLKEMGDLIPLPCNGYMPVAYCGSAFLEKFDKLEAAMHRYHAKHGISTKKRKPTTTKILDRSLSQRDLRNYYGD